jgi:hypothetical protein
MKAHKQVDLGNHLRDQLVKQKVKLGKTIYIQLEDQLGLQLYNQLNNRLWNQIANQLVNQLLIQLNNKKDLSRQYV